MKKIIIVINLVVCLTLFSACTLEASFEPGGYKSKLSVRVDGNNDNGSISEGGYLSLKIIGEDYDGISHIDLRIPAINIDQEFTNYSNNEHWEINQTFNVDTIDFSVSREIYVTLTDNDGDIYSRTFRLKVEE